MIDEQKVNLLEILKGVFEEELSGVYSAATLFSSGFIFNPAGWDYRDGYFNRIDSDKKYSDDEQYWVWKNYVKYKTPGHSYYKEAFEYVENYEKGMFYSVIE